MAPLCEDESPVAAQLKSPQSRTSSTMPRPKENAPAPVQFNLKEVQLGRRTFRSGTSGPAVNLRADPMMGLAKSQVQRYETLLCGKIMFGNKRFSFETSEFDRSPQNINKLLRKKNQEVPTSFEMSLASLNSPVYSFQVKFEDVQSMECRNLQDEWELVLNLKKPASCYTKKQNGSWQTVESPVGNAKTIRCVTAPPSEKDRVAWKCGNEVPFARARALAVDTSPMLAALFHGLPVEKEAAAPVKRKANKDTPGNVTKRLKKEAAGSRKLSDKGNELLDVDSVKESLNEYVKSLAQTVDMDWHDSYEETDEMLIEWFNECGEHAQKVIRAATDLGAGFGHAHEILKIVQDTWLNINAIPFRGCPSESLSNAEEVELVEGESLTSISELLDVAWPLLLARAAGDAKVMDGTLNQKRLDWGATTLHPPEVWLMLKDARDNGVEHPEAPHESEEKLLAEHGKAVAKAVKEGRRQRLVALMSQGEWKSCPCTVKKHRMRRCIDRRFDGPKHLRTRDYSSDSEGGCGFGGLGAFLGLF